MNFAGTFWECAGGSRLVNGRVVEATPPSREDIDVFINSKLPDEQVQYDVYHRFVLTKNSFKSFENWAKKQFFFRNATIDQIRKIEQLVFASN
jgi:hypothetical protein